jgi:hypothetical protein
MFPLQQLERLLRLEFKEPRTRTFSIPTTKLQAQVPEGVPNWVQEALTKTVFIRLDKIQMF